MVNQVQWERELHCEFLEYTFNSMNDLEYLIRCWWVSNPRLCALAYRPI